MNDSYADNNWMTVTKGKGMFERPEQWPETDPLVDIISFTLMPNHFHLLLKESREGGVSLFMKKIGQSMTEHANKKYTESGSLFQGAYRAKTIDTDTYLRYVCVYIMVKNVFELYPNGGLVGAKEDFEKAWAWALTYSFSSLKQYALGQCSSPIYPKSAFGDIFESKSYFKNFSQEVIEAGKWEEVVFE